MSRPYFETKVVKVKKKEECQHEYKVLHYRCIKCGIEFKRENDSSKPEPKGNWVNGENLDKIKFPCFCSYVYMNVKRFGELRIVSDGKYGGIYTIFNLHQEKTTSEWTVREFTLKAILENYDIHILKGKIIIYEEEK